jgi:Asp-tRNA(Asn)/Glu-tRNA(Gln) amidotransferase A subunit family amidase
MILSKTKLNSFGVWEEPTEYIDYQAPWNPRADGYQSPGGSSSGSAVAIAAYDWIDIAIGSDSKQCPPKSGDIVKLPTETSFVASGSISRPALWCGCFAMRPSYGLLPTQGLVHMIEYMLQECCFNC